MNITSLVARACADSMRAHTSTHMCVAPRGLQTLRTHQHAPAAWDHAADTRSRMHAHPHRHLSRALNLVTTLCSGLHAYAYAPSQTQNSCLNAGDSPLLWASFKGLADAVEVLLRGGADVNAMCALGNRPLHLAASADHVEVVALLLKQGADAGARNVYGATPLQLAKSPAVRGWLRWVTGCGLVAPGESGFCSWGSGGCSCWVCSWRTALL